MKWLLIAFLRDNRLRNYFGHRFKNQRGLDVLLTTQVWSLWVSNLYTYIGPVMVDTHNNIEVTVQNIEVLGMTGIICGLGIICGPGIICGLRITYHFTVSGSLVELCGCRPLEAKFSTIFFPHSQAEIFIYWWVQKNNLKSLKNCKLLRKNVFENS